MSGKKIEYPAGDDQFRDETITRVEGGRDTGWSITFESGWSFGVSKESPVVPAVGMIARQYGAGIGSIVRGMFLDGQCVYYRTEAEQDAKNKQDAEAYDQSQRDRFEKDRADMDRRYEALPEIFRKRLDKFRHNNPDFRWKFEGYELFVCEQAVVIARTLGTAKEIESFAQQSWELQKKRVPGLDGGHSGNTFGMACRLAHDFVSKPANVEARHGALAVLVGSEEYGCVPSAGGTTNV